MRHAVPPIGTLTDRVLLKNTINGAAQPLTSVWARVRALASGNQHTVIMRFRSDFREGDLAVYRGRTLRVIEAGDLNGRKAYLRCLCEEVLA